MLDIIKVILDELPKGKISSAAFEGANIVLYTKEKEFFDEGEKDIKSVVDKIKKRIILRADKSLLGEEEETKKEIKKIIPEDAEITEVLFHPARSLVIVEAKKPGIAIGKMGENLSMIKKKTSWTPMIRRSPAIRSKITEAIRKVMYLNSSYRKKFLNEIGKKIYTDWDPDKKEMWVRVTFLGGGRQVGRSSLLLQTPNSKILLDCGINVAGRGRDKFPLLDVPEFDIKALDAIIVSHAHLDHSGMVPYLFKMGYRGPVYMTAPTRDISALLALDYIGVAYKKANSPLYTMQDVKEMLKHTITINFNTVSDITTDVRLTFFNAGHTLGSAMVHLNVGNGLHNLLYTGDYKYAKTRTLDAAITRFSRLETVITEATYGSKHDVLPSRAEGEKKLEEAINRTIERKGKILVPVLGVGRAQEVMLIVEDLIKNGKVPNVPVYVDGLLWDITAIHTAYPDFMSNAVKSRIFRGENPFGSEVFKRIGGPIERQEVIDGGPCIILATSGMLVGGASVEYFKNFADNKKNTIVFVCYQGANSLGRCIKEGDKEVYIDENNTEKVQVNLEVVAIDSLTGHSTRPELIRFISNLTPSPRRVIMNHGEQSKCIDLASTIFKLNRVETTTPRNLETVRLK